MNSSICGFDSGERIFLPCESVRLCSTRRSTMSGSTCNAEHATQSMQRRACNLQHTTRNMQQEHATQSMQHAYAAKERNTEHATCNTELAHARCNTEHATYSMQQTQYTTRNMHMRLRACNIHMQARKTRLARCTMQCTGDLLRLYSILHKRRHVLLYSEACLTIDHCNACQPSRSMHTRAHAHTRARIPATRW